MRGDAEGDDGLIFRVAAGTDEAVDFLLLKSQSAMTRWRRSSE